LLENSSAFFFMLNYWGSFKWFCLAQDFFFLLIIRDCEAKIKPPVKKSRCYILNLSHWLSGRSIDDRSGIFFSFLGFLVFFHMNFLLRCLKFFEDTTNLKFFVTFWQSIQFWLVHLGVAIGSHPFVYIYFLFFIFFKKQIFIFYLFIIVIDTCQLSIGCAVAN